MPPFADELNARLAALRRQGLYRELRRVDSAQGPRIETGGKTFLNFSSNDYLGLANHPALKEAAVKAVEKFGAGAGASRLICGSLAPFHELEESLAAFKKTEAVLTFSTGYAAALGAITALAGKNDIIILDKLVHACIVDAAKLSGAKLRVCAHNNLNDLEDKLKWAAADSRHSSLVTRHILVVTESIFSMDGDATLLAKNKTHVVHCPRSHDYFKHPPFQRQRLANAGVNLCLGTDSLATVRKTGKAKPELDLFAEMRVLAEKDKTISPPELLQMATVNGARALGLAGKIGELAANAFADLIALPFTGKFPRAHEAVLEHSGNVAASMIEGRWAIPPK